MATRRKILAGAWKAYLLDSDAVELAERVARHTRETELAFDLAVCPTAPSLITVREALDGSSVKIGAQRVFWEPGLGAFTGQITAQQLAGIGCSYVIVGHSEMRELDGETDEKVNGRARAALSFGIAPIICVGESADERNRGRAHERVAAQVGAALRGIGDADRTTVLLAYEPIWAITSARNPNATPATVEQIVEMHASIRGLLAREYGQDDAARIRILYGGSVNPANAEEFVRQDDVDGLLVGSASVKADSFLALIDIVSRVAAEAVRPAV